MKIYLIFIGIIFIANAYSSIAQAKDLTDIKKCMEGKVTNNEWAECSWKEVKIQDAALKKIWKELESKYWNREE